MSPSNLANKRDLAPEQHLDNDEPDAGDLVDHVRTIHYILLAFCIAFLFLSKTNATNVYQRALDNLHRVVRISGYLGEGWLRQSVPRFLSSVKQAQLTSGPQAYSGGLVFGDRTGEVALGPIWVSVSKQISKTELNKAFIAGASPANNPSDNLEEFATAWDSMYETVLIFLSDVTGRGLELSKSSEGQVNQKAISVSSSQTLFPLTTPNPRPYLVLGSSKKEQLTVAWKEILDDFEMQDTSIPGNILSFFD
jgi:hypothetical protein